MKTITLIIAMALIGVTEIYAETKAGGFVDAQFQWNKDDTTKAFAVADGSLMLSHEMGTCTAMIDVPFNDVGATNGSFVGFADKFQAYVTHKYDMGIGWKLGQFDTMYGLEANDTKDLAMATKGIVGSNVIPVVHTGASIDMNAGPAKLNVMVANPADKGATSTPMDLGVQANVNMGSMGLKVGGLFNRVSGNMGYLIDAVANMPMGSLDLGVEFAIKKTAGATDSQMGIVGLVGFGLTDTIGLDARFSFVSNGSIKVAGTNTPIDSAMEISAGPHFIMSKNMRCKVHYTIMSNTPTSGSARSTHSAVISSIVSF